MPKVSVYKIDGSKSGEMELSADIFGIEISEPAMHQVIVAHLSNQRQGTQSALTRAEVSGGGKKPWRQKGTGRARAGSSRSPVWKHGGVTFAPKPRLYKKAVNKKVRRLALKSALTSKFEEKQLIVVEDFAIAEAKTKLMVKALSDLKVSGSALLVTPEPDQTLMRSSANLPGITAALATNLNVYEIMRHDVMVATKSAIEKIQEVYA